MTVMLALIGALVVGLLVGLLWRGFIYLGDRRQLDIVVEQLMTEQRMTASTNAAIAQMRAIIRQHVQPDRSA